jgi:hypothetical protein
MAVAPVPLAVVVLPVWLSRVVEQAASSRTVSPATATALKRECRASMPVPF